MAEQDRMIILYMSIYSYYSRFKNIILVIYLGNNDTTHANEPTSG